MSQDKLFFGELMVFKVINVSRNESWLSDSHLDYDEDKGFSAFLPNGV